MDPGGDRGARDDDAHRDDTTHGHGPGSDPAPSEGRNWTHPSEIGLQARVHSDRRRSRALVVGLVAIGVAVLLGTAAMTAMFSGSRRTSQVASAPLPLEGCLALVDILGSDGSAQATGLLVDDGHHVVVAADGLDDAEALTVRIGGSRTTGTVVAHDAYMDLALIRLASPAGSRPEMSQRSSVGDPLRIVHFDPAGHRRSSQVRVDDVAMTWSRPDHTIAKGVIALSGDTVDTGVLADPKGAVAGLVIGTADGRSVAYGSEVLSSLVARLRAGGNIEHPWIGVRAGDLPETAATGTTPVGDPAMSVPRRGALVLEVLGGSPAEAAGIAEGDVITAVNGRPVTDMADLADAVSPLPPGELATVAVMRNGEETSFNVEVGTFPG